MSEPRKPEQQPEVSLDKRPYVPPAIVWEETLEVKGTLGTSDTGQPFCDEG